MGEGGEGVGLDILVVVRVPVEGVVHVEYHGVVGTVVHGVSLQKARVQQIYKGGSGLHWES